LIQRPERSVSAARFSDCASQRVSKRPIWLGDAPLPFAASHGSHHLRPLGVCSRTSAKSSACSA
jgi:hypothetical protein